jgi:hypothetical protein
LLTRKKPCWTEIHAEMDEETDVTMNEAQRWLNTSVHGLSGGRIVWRRSAARDMVPTGAFRDKGR